MKQQAGSLKRSNKVANLWQDQQTKKERRHILPISSMQQELSLQTADNKDNKEILYTHKFDNLDERTTFSKKHKLLQSTQYKLDNLNSPITNV